MARASKEDLDAALLLRGMLCDVFDDGSFPRKLDGEFDPERTEFDEYAYDDLRALYLRLEAVMQQGGLTRVIGGMCVLCDPQNKVIDPDCDYLSPYKQEGAESAEELWLVGQCKNWETGRWEFQGVFATREEAEAICRVNYFIYPVKIGEAAPHETVAVPAEQVVWPCVVWPCGADAGAHGCVVPEAGDAKPTAPGWWWARSPHGEWQPVLVSDGGPGVGLQVDISDGPLVPLVALAAWRWAVLCGPEFKPEGEGDGR